MFGRIVGIRTIILVIAVALLAGVSIRYMTDSWSDSKTSGISGTVESSGTARIGGAFAMVDHRGRQVTDADFRGKFMLLLFGYTFCPDVCPTELQTMSDVLDTLGPKAENIQPIFVTIDPERDTVAVLADYLSNFHSRLIGLTGTELQISEIARTYGVFYARAKVRDAPDQDKDKDYLMNHSSYIFLMDRDGKFRAAFRAGIAIKGMVRRIRDELGK